MIHLYNELLDFKTKYQDFSIKIKKNTYTVVS